MGPAGPASAPSIQSGRGLPPRHCGLGSLWCFLKSTLAETMESEANGKGGSSHNPGASWSPPRTLPSHPNRVPDGVAGFQSSE